MTRPRFTAKSHAARALTDRVRDRRCGRRTAPVLSLDDVVRLEQASEQLAAAAREAASELVRQAFDELDPSRHAALIDFAERGHVPAGDPRGVVPLAGLILVATAAERGVRVSGPAGAARRVRETIEAARGRAFTDLSLRDLAAAASGQAR